MEKILTNIEMLYISHWFAETFLLKKMILWYYKMNWVGLRQQKTESYICVLYNNKLITGVEMVK